MRSINVFICMTFAFMLVVGQTQAQKQTYFAQDVNGSPIRETKYTNVNGSPYLLDKWTNGTVQLEDGKTYKVELKYDLIADELTFKSDKGDSLNFIKTVKQFQLEYTPGVKSEAHLFRSGFPSTGGKTGLKSFYEVLYDGGTKLLKKQTKSIWTETTAYGTANQTKNITERINYFVYKQDKMMPVKADKKAIISALGDKSVELEKYIKDNKLDLKRDDELVKLFTYYNSL